MRSLLLAIFMLMAGGGFMTTLVSVRLEQAGHSPLVVGLVATAYFVGLAAGSLFVGRVIRQVGHIRTFAAVVSLLSASTLVYALHDFVGLWFVLRLIDGLCVASVFVCLESWLNERAEPATRGSVLASYMIALYAGQAAGQFMLNLGGAPSLPFIAASILVSLAIIPIALTRLEGPAVTQQTALSIGQLYTASPLGLLGVVITGLVLGAFYALGAVYARGLGLTLSATALLMSAVIAGGVALQWPIGVLSDRFERRAIIIWVIAGATAISLALTLAGASGALLLLLAGGFGGLVFALYPLCVAHTNDHLTSSERVGASGGLVLAYSAGAALGPLAGSLVMQALGPAGLFAWATGCAGAALVFGLWRQRQRAPVPAAQQQSYQLLPRTTPMAAKLDPLAPDG